MLQISYSQGVFEVEGKLAQESAPILEKEVKTLLEAEKQVILSLDKLDKIDSYGVNAISVLYKKAIRNNKIFYIIGRENKKIKKALTNSELRYMVRRDVF